MNSFIYNYIDSHKTPCYDFLDKDSARHFHIMQMLLRTQSMFQYKGLPDSIPARNLELMLQTRGHVAFHHVKGKLYVFIGGLGGEPDVYYMPTIYTVANPALNYSANLKIGEDCIVMPNDALYMGVLPILTRYAEGMTESEISLRTALINTRIVDLISAPDDATKESAEKFLKDVEDGKLGVIAENAFLDGIRATPYGATGNTNTITNLIEFEQYWKASVFNELGLNANYNMKRESINSGESQLNNDALSPFIDNMLKTRRDALEKVNEMFGTDITVEFASSWEQNELEESAELDAISERSETDEPVENEDEPTEETEESEETEE